MTRGDVRELVAYGQAQAAILAERERQADIGWGRRHDRGHVIWDWIGLFRKYEDQYIAIDADRKQALAKLGALVLAALEVEFYDA